VNNIILLKSVNALLEYFMTALLCSIREQQSIELQTLKCSPKMTIFCYPSMFDYVWL